MKITLREKGKSMIMMEVQKIFRQKFKNETYLPVMDILCTELLQRFKRYRKCISSFEFWIDFSTNSDDSCEMFKEILFRGIGLEFIDEMPPFKYFIAQLDDEKSYKLIFGNLIQSTFPDIMTSFQIYRNRMITNCLRTTMAQKDLKIY